MWTVEDFHPIDRHLKSNVETFANPDAAAREFRRRKAIVERDGGACQFLSPTGATVDWAHKLTAKFVTPRSER